MLQRSISDETDPARGTWEFPGGKLDNGEDPFDGARREWEEETGIKLPPGDRAGEWRSGPYTGHVYVVPSEEDVPLNLGPDQRLVGNPDDPDGDDCEVLAWWTPSDAAANPSLRPEAKQGTDWGLIKRAVPGAVFKSIRRPVRASIRRRSFPVLLKHQMGEAGLEAAHYRLAEDPHECCGTCAFFQARAAECSMFDAPVKPHMTCDDWAANDVRKEQPSAEQVHIDSASGNGRKRKRSDEPEDAQRVPDADELELSVIKADLAKQLVYGIVLEPHRVDSQGDWEDEDDIEKAAHRYLGQTFNDGVTDLVNLQHRWDAPGVFPVESYVAPVDFTLNGEKVQKGSWVLVMKVADPATWQEVLDGTWGGFSVEGTGRRNYDHPAPPAVVAKEAAPAQPVHVAVHFNEGAFAAPHVETHTHLPEQTQPPAVLNVTVPEQQPPVIHNHVAPAEVNVQPPDLHTHIAAPEVHVHQEQPKPRAIRVEERKGVKRYIPEV